MGQHSLSLPSHTTLLSTDFKNTAHGVWKKKKNEWLMVDPTEFQSVSLCLCVRHCLPISNLMRINTSKIACDFHKLIRIEND